MMKPTNTKLCWRVLGVMVALTFALLWTTRARAQTTDPSNDRLCDATKPSTCGPGGVNGSTTVIVSGLPTLSFTNVGASETGTAYLVILVPGTNTSLSFMVNGAGPVSVTSGFGSGNIFSFLNVSEANNLGFSGDFTPFSSATGQVIATPTSFTVYLFSLGSYCTGGGVGCAGPIPISFAGSSSGFPIGTVIWGYLVGAPQGGGKCSGGSTTCAADAVPLSDAVTIVPEPASLALLGSGLLAIGGVIRGQLAG